MVSEENLVSRAHEELVVSDLGFEKIVLDLRKGCYYGLNSTAKYLFTLIAEPVAVRDLIEAVTERYQIPRGKASTDVLLFLKTMSELRLIRIERRDEHVGD